MDPVPNALARTIQQHAATGANAKFFRQIDMLKRIDHLQADVFLHFFQPRDVGKAEDARDPEAGKG